MAKFDLKKAILENKATFFSSLTEGQFSWMTQDTGQQIGSQDENKIPVYMFDDKGKYYYENDYDGYGEFGGKDYYDLVAEMNGYTADDAEKFGGTFGELRGIGIKLAFGELEPKNEGPVLFPALVTRPNEFDYKTHDFTKEAKNDPNQSWYAAEEDDEDDDEDEELDEGKVEEAYNTYTFKVAKNFAKYMSKKESKNFEVTMNSVDEYSFDLDLDGEPYAGGSYLIQNGNIHNVAIPGNPIYATTDDMEDYIGEGYDEFKRADKGSKNVTAKNKGEEEVYGAGVKKGEEIEKKKMKKSELKAKIKEMVLAEMNLDVTDETSGYDFLAELEGMLSEEDVQSTDPKIKAINDKIQNDPEFLGNVEDAMTKAKQGDSSDLAMLMVGLRPGGPPMFEAKKDEEEVTDDVTDGDETVDVTDDFSMEEPQGPGKIDVTQNANADLTGTKKDVQDNLEAALEAARTLGDEKLATQVGNTITFFNKQHVVKDTTVAESLNESMFPMLKKILK